MERSQTLTTTAMALDDAALCAAITREHARTFTLASHLLPAHKRRAAFAVYAFCRVADDMVDLARVGDVGQPASAPGNLTADRLAGYGAELELALAGQPRGSVMRELARAIQLHDIPAAALRELLSGIARDLHPTRYANWEALRSYCEGVASSVGEMCMQVFGVDGEGDSRQRAVRHARTLGVAMQLTNILRDVGEDARRGRCYLPEDELDAVGLQVGDVLDAGRRGDASFATNPRWRELLRFQVARAEFLYAAATPGIALLAPDARRCATACSTGYAAILGAIERCGYDTLSRRARVSGMRRMGILWRAWRGTGTTDAAVDLHMPPMDGAATPHGATAAEGDATSAWRPSAARPLAALGRPGS